MLFVQLPFHYHSIVMCFVQLPFHYRSTVMFVVQLPILHRSIFVLFVKLPFRCRSVMSHYRSITVPLPSTWDQVLGSAPGDRICHHRIFQNMSLPDCPHRIVPGPGPKLRPGLGPGPCSLGPGLGSRDNPVRTIR